MFIEEDIENSEMKKSYNLATQTTIDICMYILVYIYFFYPYFYAHMQRVLE